MDLRVFFGVVKTQRYCIFFTVSLLFVSGLYLEVKTKHELKVDTSRGQKIEINVS